MGNYKFKFSDMIPNAWFYKLKYSRTRKQNITKKKQHQTTSSSSIAAASAQQPSKLQQSHLSNQRKSYHFTRDQTAAVLDQDSFYNNLTAYLRDLESRHCTEPPRKSSNKRRSTRRNKRHQSNRRSPRLVTSSVSAGCSCGATLESVWAKPDSTPEHYPSSPLDSSSENESVLPQYGSDVSLIPDTFDGMLSWSTSCRCRADSGDFVTETEYKPCGTKIVDEPDKVSELDLPPIITKPNKVSDKKDQTNNEPTKIRRSSAKFEERTVHGSFSLEVVKEDIVSTTTTTCSKEHKYNNGARKSSVQHSPAVKLRTNSPRIAHRRMQGRKSVSSTLSSTSSRRRSLSESFAVVKSSKDPRKDFRESMVEMILENNIFASKDLEDLLACYLSLNSDEYHDLIIKVFKQIWFDIIDPRLK